MDLTVWPTGSRAWARRWLIFALLLIGPTLAETRSALVVGNDVYTSFTPLKNAKNDARAMAKELEKLGFTVTLSEDASSAQLETTVKNWTAGLKNTDVAMFFYAGHGVQVEGTNYLVPIDFDGDEIDIKHTCLNADMIRERMEKSGPDTNIIVLDACRNNPFSNSRGGSRGLQFMEGNVGTLIAFATSPGGISNDNPDGQNGLFTKHLLANLSSPGLDALQVFQNVGRGVYAESGGKQKPWISASVMPRTFQFVQGPASGSAAPLSTPPAEPSGQVTVIDTPPEVAVADTAATNNRGNVGRIPKPNIVLLLVAEDAARSAWLLELARDRIYKWYGGDPSGTDITLNVEYISFSDAKGRAMLEKTFALKRDDLPAMLSAVKVNGNFESSLAMQRRIKESTNLGPFFDTLFEPLASTRRP